MGNNTYAYYPGCTQETTAKEYNESVKAVCSVLDIQLKEIPGWICCGASSGHTTDYWLSHTLSGKNLALAEKLGIDTAVACPACYQRLVSTLKEFRAEAELKDKLPSLIGQPFEAKYNVRHILDIFCNDVGYDTIQSKVVKPLTGLKVVAYYGCYLVRPPALTGFDDAENPQTMDNLLQVIGTDVTDWRGKVSCCGGSHSFTLASSVKDMVSDIIAAAREVEAEAIVTACPLCQVNLETRQSGNDKMPILYVTELLGLAMGLDSKHWFERHLISPLKLLAKHFS
ncbi:MAG: CoB--CoM heterodisulfide reductase iron-sulfur subunit B family protein [Dehalococcoidales bacterium]|nr:CoB--CoM heterodisulfide reductase iron-sulfur subunit B family protein [Dehalococcoidales bacterium]